VPVLIRLKIFLQGGTKSIIMCRLALGMQCCVDASGTRSYRAGILVCAQGGQMFKQPLAAWLLSCPGDYLIYNGGLSPFSSVWKDRHKSIAPFVNSSAFGAWVRSCHWQVQHTPQSSNIASGSLLDTCPAHKMQTSQDSSNTEGDSLESCCSPSSALDTASTGPQRLGLCVCLGFGFTCI